MKILIVTNHFWPEIFRINDLALGLKEKGHRITVLTAIPDYPGGRYFKGYGILKRRREFFNGIEVIRAPLIPRGDGSNVRLALNYLSYALSASLIAPFVCRGEYDLIFVFETSPVTVGLPALVLKKIKSTPIFFWVQDLWPESVSAVGAVRSKIVLKMLDKLVRLIYRGCDRVLVQSKAFFPAVEGQGVESSRILYFPNSAEALYRPVDLEDDAPERAETPPGFRVMFAGNIGAAQGFDTFIEAADRLRDYPDIRWVILGDGKNRPALELEVRRRGLEKAFHFLGRRPMETMPRYFALADALLVTLKRHPVFSLSIPSKLQSYMACGRPIISALDGEGSREVAKAGAGLTCDAEDPAALAETILSMRRLSEEERRDMGRRARKYFEEHFERTMLLDRLDDWMKSFRKDGGACAS